MKFKMKVSMRLNIIGMLVVAITFHSNAQDICASYLEKVIQPIAPDVLWGILANVPNVKGEYETTVAFEGRVADAMKPLAHQVVVEVPIQRKFITYNADKQIIDVQKYAFSNSTTKYDGVFGYGSPFYDKVEYGSENIDVVFSDSESTIGSYIGTNAMGVKIRVTKVKRITKSIFERKAGFNENLFPAQIKYDDPVVSWKNVPPDVAKKVKESARVAFVYVPKPPYFATGKFPWGDPTIQNPKEIDERIDVAIGDIQCALLLNSVGKVYAAVPTR
jgi:hypothetical protein